VLEKLNLRLLLAPDRSDEGGRWAGRRPYQGGRRQKIEQQTVSARSATLDFRQTTVRGVTAFSGNRESGAERRQQARKLILAEADVLT
jgi:hypothetical protein